MLKETDGFDIVVNGVNRSFRDVKLVAFAAGITLKNRNPRDEVQIRNRSTGALATVMSDGRTT